LGNPRLNTMVRGETMLVNAKLASDVSDLIMGGGNSIEVAIEIIKLVTNNMIRRKQMPVPEGVITTTEILQPEPEVVEEVVEEKEEPK
jgi:hypothetical protein